MESIKEIYKLKACHCCFSDWLEEVFDASTNEYHVECVSCGHKGPKTFIQNETFLLWNESCFSKEEEEILLLQECIDELEAEIELNEEDIWLLKGDLDCIEDERNNTTDKDILKFLGSRYDETEDEISELEEENKNMKKQVCYLKDEIEKNKIIIKNSKI